MQTDPIEEWQRLTQHYREMNDGELQELDADKADLTEVAQQVLRDEIKKRGLDREINSPGRFATPQWNSHGDTPAEVEATEEGEPPVEFTWKTLLCECEDQEQVWQIREVLRQAGIESWTEIPGYNIAPEMSSPRIVVAADQLEKAQEIIAKPIPEEIVEQSKMDISDYVPPVCPSCGAADPILEGADPVNSWQCESCGRQWTEQAEEKESPEREP